MNARLLLVVAMAACGAVAGCNCGPGGAPDAGPIFAFSGYWLSGEEDFSGLKTEDVYDVGCGLLAVVSTAFENALIFEGTGRLLDGGVVSYAGACSCGTKFECYQKNPLAYQWGVGVNAWPLVPFRSIAVDPTVIPYDAGMYIPALDGLTMPGDAPWGGFVHDGCVRAQDTGGLLTDGGQRIRWFVGTKSSSLALGVGADGGLSSVVVLEGGTRCP